MNDALPAGADLGGYTVDAVLGQGGFGIVYRARHKELHFLVAIKEYFPTEMAIRSGAEVRVRSEEGRKGFEDGLRRFLEEARALVALRDVPFVVECRDLFRANGTAYLVMEYEVGLPLSEVLAQREAAGSPFTESDLFAVVTPLVEGLAKVHSAAVLHRDIKPSNIVIRRADEQPVLIDFGASKHALAVHTKSLAPYTAGYAAPEQVGEEESLGPWTDIYAVGAVMWRIVAGGARPWDPPNPVKAESRLLGIMGTGDPLPTAQTLGAGRFSESVLAVIDRCLAVRVAERVQNCGDLLRMLGPEVARDSQTEESRASGPVAVKPNREPRGKSEIFPHVRASGGDLSEPAVSTAARTSQIGSASKSPWGMLAVSAIPILVLVSILVDPDTAGPAGMEFVWIPQGEFVMGSDESGDAYFPDSTPPTHVQISRGFQLGKYEVTQKQWIDVMGNNPSWFKGCGYDCPVENVSWYDAQEFIAKLNASDHEWRYRLPTEAEWEYAARAESRRSMINRTLLEIYLRQVAWFGSSSNKTQPVGQLASNEWGLYDMLGNVWEWTADWHGKYPGGLATDPTGASTGLTRVYRGCSWNSTQRECGFAIREAKDPDHRHHNVGFRLVRVK